MHAGKNEMDNNTITTPTTTAALKHTHTRQRKKYTEFCQLFYTNRNTIIKTSRNRNVELAAYTAVGSFQWLESFCFFIAHFERKKFHAIFIKYCVIHVLLM